MGVEIGGTFTDLVLVDRSGVVRTAKEPSTPAAPEVGAFSAMDTTGVALNHVDVLVHGSTIATNAVVQRRGATVGLLVTKGFGDLLELQRQARTNVFELKYQKPPAVVDRGLVEEVDERIRADGRVERVPDPEAVTGAVQALIDRGASSLAVCLLHAYRYPRHEALIGEIVRRRWANIPIAFSHEIAPIYREYERASTTALSAYVLPIVARYLAEFESGLRRRGFRGELHVMQSNGGVLPVDLARRDAVRLVQSGPAGGVTAARVLARQLRLSNCIAFDMGGTSTDVCLIEEGEADITSEAEVEHLPVRVPMLNITSVGAGGGSIARIDAQGILRVGPESAGADPGPACYGRGGSFATVTDANVVLGIIRPSAFLGGRMPIDLAAATEACRRLGAELGNSPKDAARAIVRVANATMEGALRIVTTERGVDPRRFWLICYGGAGAQHAVALSEALRLRGVIVPRLPGLFSAYGLVIADLRREWTATLIKTIDEVDKATFGAILRDLRRTAEAALSRYQGRIRWSVTLQMRYPGQAFELDVPLPVGGLEHEAIAHRFHRAHHRRYGHAATSERPQVVSVRLAASVDQGTVPVPEAARIQSPPRSQVRPRERTAARTRYLSRSALAVGRRVAGPVVLEEETSTIFVPSGWTARLERYGDVRLERR
jgi:N-methylhydantoinase A